MTNGLNVLVGQGSGTRYLPLAQIAPLVRREVTIDPAATYIELGVRSFHKGTFHRRSLVGAEFSWQDLYRIEQGDLVFSNIMAWEGAVALAGPQDDGCIGNHRMLTCACDPDVADPAFLAYYFKTTEGMAKLIAASTGTVARNRTLTASALGRIEVPMPPLPKQQRIVQHLELLDEKTRQLAMHIDAIESNAAAQFMSLHHRLSDGHVVRLGDVIELVEEVVTIRPEGQYPQVGVRGFGGGLFAKPAVAGADTTYRTFNRLYADAIVMSQVKGWEGALALCPPDLAGMFVSPEYRTFRCLPHLAKPAYLDALIRTPWFWSLLQAATRGVGARRERTRPEQFLNLELPLPTLHRQQQVVDILSRETALKQRHAAIRAANDALIPATLERIFQSVGD
ncbi:MAG: restriction endonuclease subunit S [Burkholderiaceae bacterium]|nr:restriction endonuclease subunit S [Burkholderiaceae bacterium]